MREFILQISSLEFWEAIFENYIAFGPLVGLLLAMVESFIPALSLIAITALNVAAFGQSISASLQHPFALAAGLLFMVPLYMASVRIRKKHSLEKDLEKTYV